MRDLFLKLSSVSSLAVNIWPVLHSSCCGCLVQKRIERSFCQILEDQLLGDCPRLLEQQELLEDQRLLHLGAHLPTVQGVAAGVLRQNVKIMIEMKQCEECVINCWEGVQYF